MLSSGMMTWRISQFPLLSRKTRHRPRELMKKMAAAKLLLLRERGMLFEITLTQN